MFEMVEVTHICCSHLENCKRIWKTKEPALIAREGVVFDQCDQCEISEKENNMELIGGEE